MMYVKVILKFYQYLLINSVLQIVIAITTKRTSSLENIFNHDYYD